MVLLDTHVLLWMLFDDGKLSERAIEALKHQSCCVSIASIWELAIKISLGKLKLPRRLKEKIGECVDMGIDLLDITAEDCLCLQSLPWVHRDPFDRMPVAQAITANIPLVTHDGNIQKYSAVDCIW